MNEEKDSLSMRAAKKTYRGVWAVLRNWLRVPEDPPHLPVHAGGHVDARRPAEGFLRYSMLFFWVFGLLFDVCLIAGWIVVLIVAPVVGLAIAIPVWAIAIVPDIIAYVAIHVRYDTTWYVLSDRSMRLRRGIWILHESTITYENVQNVTVSQGPVQRYFGIANVVVQTAGGATSGPHGSSSVSSGHLGVLEGVEDAAELRDMIMDRVRASRSAGLGDERHEHGMTHSDGAPGWTSEHVEVLREIRDAVKGARR